MMRTPSLPGLTSALVALVALVSLGACNKGKADASADQPVRTVRVEEVSLGEVVSVVELVGELEGIEEVRVLPQVADRIRSVAVKEGDEVKAGEVLAVVNADLQSSAVSQAQAGMEAAIANRDAVLDNLNRTRELARAGSVTASQLQSLEAQARAAEAQVRQASAGLGQASTQRGRAIIRAPIAGVVSQVTVKAGDMAAPSMPILTLVRDHRVKAVFRVPERDFLLMKEGLEVAVHPLAQASNVVKGQITLRGATVDRLTRTGLIEVHLDNPDKRLVAGSSVRGKVELGRREGVVLVPSEAIMLTGATERTGMAVAFVTDGKLAQRRDVKVGARQGGKIEIVEGLKAGDSLIVQGAHFLRDQSPVKVAADGRVAASEPRGDGPAAGVAQ